MELENLHLEEYSDKGINMAIEYGPKLFLSIILLWAGLKIIGILIRNVDKGMAKGNFDETLRPFLTNLLGWALKFTLFISVASILGVETTSFVAVLGAAGLAVGLALQGTLGNFASGVMLLVFRPFKVGDFVDAGGHSGTVEEISIFVTKLRSPENRLIIVPNAAVGADSLINYTDAPKVQARMSIGISYDANIAQAREVLITCLSQDADVLHDEPKEIFVTELGDSSVNLSVRFWTAPDIFWPTYFRNLEACKVALDTAGIEIPFPQRVVHMKNK